MASSWCVLFEGGMLDSHHRTGGGRVTTEAIERGEHPEEGGWGSRVLSVVEASLGRH